MSISKGRLSIALVLIGLGAWQLAINISPEFHNLAYSNQYWPVNIVGFGVFLGLIGLFTWSPGWFVPACIVTGIGGLLYYNNMTGDWSTWVYAWTLIPGFVAAGLLLLGLATWKRGPVIAAGWTLFASLVLFGIFGSTLGGLAIAGTMGAAAVILLGLMVLVSPFLRKKKPPQ